MMERNGCVNSDRERNRYINYDGKWNGGVNDEMEV